MNCYPIESAWLCIVYNYAFALRVPVTWESSASQSYCIPLWVLTASALIKDCTLKLRCVPNLVNHIDAFLHVVRVVLHCIWCGMIDAADLRNRFWLDWHDIPPKWLALLSQNVDMHIGTRTCQLDGSYVDSLSRLIPPLQQVATYWWSKIHIPSHVHKARNYRRCITSFPGEESDNLSTCIRRKHGVLCSVWSSWIHSVNLSYIPFNASPTLYLVQASWIGTAVIISYKHIHSGKTRKRMKLLSKHIDMLWSRFCSCSTDL